MKKEENKTTKKILSLIRKAKKDKKKKKEKLAEKDIKKYSMTQLDHVISKLKEQELKYIVVCVSLMLIIVLTVCYIVFSSIQSSIYDDTIISGKLLIDYEEKNDNIGNIINLTGLNNDKNAEEYAILITNTSEKNKAYIIKIIEDDEMIKLDGCKEKLIPREKIKYSYNNEVLSLTNDEIIITDKILPEGSAYYKFKIWVEDDNLNKKNHYHARFYVSEK